MKPVPSGEALNSLRDIYDINRQQVNDILQIYESTQDDDLRQIILQVLNRNIKYASENKRFQRLYKNLVHGENKLLAALAFQGLTEAELTKDENNNDQWQNWQWSPDIKNLLEKAVETDMYLLSRLGRFELLELSKRYPNSKFTKGCKEYTRLTDGDTYFGNDLDYRKYNFRQPFDLDKQLKVWHRFIKDYPNHPGTNDALYRIARAYELQKDYENAILWYRKASQEGDNDFYSGRAESRILFLIDSVMSSESIANFLSKNLDNYFTPILDYSKAVHLIREDKLLDAKTELEKFVNYYKKNRISLGSNYYIDNTFWDGIQKRIEQIEQLEKIRKSKKTVDEKLYDEASFLFYNPSFYSLLWSNNGFRAFGTSSGFIPFEWEGVNTFFKYTVHFEFVEKVSKNCENQNTLLKSLKLFKKIVQDYPKSKVKEKAAYSIALSYYYLSRERWRTPLRQKDSWNDLAIKAFDDFVSRFPKSSMADDALLSIAALDNKLKDRVLEKLIKDYPKGDRRQEAESMLARSSSSYFVGVGVRLQNIDKNQGVLIRRVLTDSPASKARLQSGDIILQIDGKEVSNTGDVVDIVTRHQPRETVEFQIERGGKKRTVKVVTELMRR